MNYINRHNYETFFLLYTDNELTVAEKKAVDEFVQSNPDLQEELVMLQQSILKPDSIVFDDKRSLLKNELVVAPVYEKLLLRLDNELTVAERNEMEELIETDADIRKEWNLLQQTKIPVEEIVFKNKQSLYRKEAGRLVAFPWWKATVAAGLIGFGLWGGMAYFNNIHKTVAFPIANNGTKAGHRIHKPVAPQSMAPVVLTIAKVNKMDGAGIGKKISIITAGRSIAKKTYQKFPGRDMEMIVVKQKTNNLPKPYSENVNPIGRNKMIHSSVTRESLLPANNEVAKISDKQHNVNSYASTASYAENNEDNDDRVLFMKEESLKKTKLGGIFRKVKRVLERNANIKSGDNNMKVANLEFPIQ